MTHSLQSVPGADIVTDISPFSSPKSFPLRIENSAGIAEIVALQILDPLTEEIPVENLHQGLDPLLKKDRLVADHVEPFTGNRNEIETEHRRNRYRSDPRVRFTGENRQPDFDVGENLVLITGDPVRSQTGLLQVVVQQQARPGTFLAIDESDPVARQIRESGCYLPR